MLAVRAVDDVPRSARLLRRLEAVLERAFHACVVPRVPLVLGGDAPARGLVFHQAAQASLLQLGPDVQVHLDDRHAVGHQHALEPLDALEVAPHPRRRAAGPAYRRGEQVLVPAAVQDHDATLWRHHAPVTPQRRPLALDLVRLTEAVHRDELGVQPTEQFVHDFAAAGPGDARDDHDDRPGARLAQLELRVEQLVLQLGQLVLVLELRQPSATQSFVQHPAYSPFPVPLRRVRAAGTCCVMQWTLPPPSVSGRGAAPRRASCRDRSSRTRQPCARPPRAASCRRPRRPPPLPHRSCGAAPAAPACAP